MFNKFVFVLSLFFICLGSAQANYHLGIAAFERGEYQKAFDLMKPIAEKGGTYVVAYMDHIRDNKLIVDAKFQLPIEIPKTIRKTSEGWLKASLLYMQINEMLGNDGEAKDLILKGKGKKNTQAPPQEK